MSGAGDATIVRYAALGYGFLTGAAGTYAGGRLYCPGNVAALSNGAGLQVVSYYSEGLFKPGTAIRWEPSVSFTTSGRVYCGFTDNPEVIAAYYATASDATRLNIVKGLGNMISFPVWQETDVPFPTRARRRMFDTNETLDTADTNAISRSVQTGFLAAIDGAPATTTVGSFWYHDVVAVEGLQAVAT